MFSLWLLGVLVLILCGLLVQYRLKWRRYHQLAALVPTFKGRLPIIGHMLKLIGGSERFWNNVLELCEDAEEAGGVMSVWAGPNVMFCINDPDDAWTLLNSCLEKSYFYKMGACWVGDGLITANVPSWKRHRKLINATFSMQVLDGFLPVFNRQATLLAQDLEPMSGAGEFDPREYFGQRTLETICQTAVGISIEDRSVIDNKYKKAVEVGLEGFAQRLSSFWLHPDFIYRFSSLRMNIDKAVVVLHNKYVTNSRRFIAFLDLMLDLADDGCFTDDQIQQELDTIIAAGHDTTSRTILNAVVLVGTHQAVQEKVHEEIMSVLGSSSDISKEDMARLVYTEAVVKEVLRISPIVPIIARDIDKEIKLKNYTLPAGSGCMVLFWGIHRLPMWGEDRLQFRPERWLDPASVPQNPGAFCAFSLGRRNCVGKNYGLLAVKTMLVHLVRKYRISADYSKVKRKFDLLLKYEEGYQISVELRENQEVLHRS